MLSLTRPSFRQLLLVAFLFIALLLSAASLRGLFTFESLLRQSAEGARQAVAQTTAAQSLAERSVVMERAARQYLVLGDPVLRQRFDEAAREADTTLRRLGEGGQLPAELPDAWRRGWAAVEAQLLQPGVPDVQREAVLSAAFRDLDVAAVAIAEKVRQANEGRNRELFNELEEGRAQLGRQILAAIGIAIVLALVFGVWLARPLQRLGKAVVALGENRLDEPIGMRGPSDVRELGQRLEWLRLRLAELDADKARFLRHVSHELKTPLAALHEGVALLEEGVAGQLNDGQREVVRILKDNTAVLQRQIEDLLRFNAAAFEARRLVRRPADLKALVEDVVARQRLQWQARRLSVRVTGEPLRAEVDADKLGIALGNLLSNATRFSPPGATITWTVSQLPGRACIDVADQGPGVAAPDRARVFEPFYRGELQPEGASRGSGIGLSIVHEYVTAHGGQVELLPDGPGARFHIELPYVR